jgi:hypothetical protein
LVDRAWGVHLGILVEVLAVDGDDLSVEDELDIRTGVGGRCRPCPGTITRAAAARRTTDVNVARRMPAI